MTFLALNIEISYLTIQKNELEFEQVCITEELNNATEELQDYQDSDNYDSTSDIAQNLTETESYYKSQQDSITSQLTMYNTEIDQYTKAKEANIKSGCTLSLSV